MLRLFFVVFAGILGAVVGSFLNVCIYRLPRQCMSIMRPGSRCPRCRTPIRWYWNIPILSWVALGGRCATCKEPISARYPLVELLTALVFAYVALVSFAGTIQSPTWQEIGFFFAKSSLMAMLIATTFIDIDYRIVPDEISLTGIVLGLLFSAALPAMQERPDVVSNPHLGSFLAAVLGAFVGAASIFVAGVMGKVLFRKESMGMGDVKFMAMVGAFLGWKAALLSFLIACFIGSFFGIAIRLVTKEQYIAFVPYLASGATIMLFWGNHVLSFIERYIFHQVPL